MCRRMPMQSALACGGTWNPASTAACLLCSSFATRASCAGAQIVVGEVATDTLDWSLELLGVVVRRIDPVPKSVEVVLGVYKDEQGEGEVLGNIDAVFVRADGLLRDGFDGEPSPPEL